MSLRVSILKNLPIIKFSKNCFSIFYAFIFFTLLDLVHYLFEIKMEVDWILENFTDFYAFFFIVVDISPHASLKENNTIINQIQN